MFHTERCGQNISEPAKININNDRDGRVVPSGLPVAWLGRVFQVRGGGGGGGRRGGQPDFLPLQPSHTLCWVLFIFLYLSTHESPPSPSAVNHRSQSRPRPLASVQAPPLSPASRPRPPRQPHLSEAEKTNPLIPQRDQEDAPAKTPSALLLGYR